MNIKANLIKSGVALGFGTILISAFALDPTQEKQVLISSPSYIVDELDLGPYNDCTTDCSATLLTKDKQYQIEVTFEYIGRKDREDLRTYYDAEITEIGAPQIFKYDDESKVEDQLDQYEIAKIKDALVTKILEKRA